MTDDELNKLVDKIKEGLKTSGMSDSEVTNTLKVLFEILYEEIVNDAIEKLEFDQFKKLEHLRDSEITPETIDELLGLNLETITKHMLGKLSLYNDNLQTNLPLLRQSYLKHKVSATIMDKLKNYI